MARLSKVVITSTLVISVLLFAMRINWFYQSGDSQLAKLHFQECELPCWIGIELGKTHIDDAKRVILSHYPNSKVYYQKDIPAMGVLLNDKPLGLSDIVLSYSSDEVILDIELYFEPVPQTILAGDISKLVGEPKYVMLPENGADNVWRLTFEQPNSTIYLLEHWKGDRPNWNAPLHALIVSQDIFPFELHDYKLVPWQGEKSFNKYWCSSPPTDEFHNEFYNKFPQIPCS